MRRFQVAILFAILFCVVMACRQSDNSGITVTPASPSHAVSTPQTSSLDNEAIAAVKEFWEQHTTKCGDSYFSSEDFRGIITQHEYKGVSFVAKGSGPSTEADRLNGIEWNGVVQQRARLQRDNHEGVWSDWKSSGGYDIGATKRQGRWLVTQDIHITQQRKMECEPVE
ncbi:MAG: hypothetical protein DMF68_21930 [Acidobacteria bacterium]|nr:MAG: hypothetical protein DMF68_21930 [Acidobacteriota bacterium]